MKVAFRADASLDIGTGHVMRCLTLARALAARGHLCSFVCRDLPGHMAERVATEFPVTLLPPPAPDSLPDPTPAHARWAGVSAAQDAAETRAVITDADVLVVDHYAFDARWQRAARPEGARLVVLDDLADRPHACDLLVDPNLGRIPGDYDALVPEAAERLTGTRYALLRPEFAAARAASLARRDGALREILIAMGGVDRDDITSRMLHALASLTLPPALRVTVVLGAAAPHLAAVTALAAALPFACTVLSGVSDMASLMTRADLAIGAAGGTAWERCTLGLPSLMLVLADNQIEGTTALARSGGAITLGLPEDPAMPDRLAAALAHLSAPAALAAMSDRAAALCDGKGTGRVVAAIEHPLNLRRAVPSDAEPIWHWRAALPPDHFRAGPNPPLADHLSWFARALADPHRHLLILHSDAPVAHLRLDVKGETANVSILVNPDLRGQGYGGRALAFLASYASRHGLRHLIAEVAASNTASQHLFRSAGYVEGPETDGFLRFDCQIQPLAMPGPPDHI